MPGHIESLTLYLPEEHKLLNELAPSLKLTPLDVRMFSRFYGLERFPRAPGSLNDMFHPLLSKFVECHTSQLKDIKYVVHTHTLPAVKPFPDCVKAMVSDYGFSADTEYFSLTMGHCSTSLTAIDFLSRKLKPGEYALLLIGEKAFHPKVELINDTTIMGECACAVLISNPVGAGNVIGRFTTQAGEFNRQSGHFYDNGPVFSDHYFPFILNSLKSAFCYFGITADTLSWLAPHNVNLSSWNKIMGELGISKNKVMLDNIKLYGHCFGADPFINLATLIKQGKAQPNEPVLLASVGMGATFSSLLIQQDAHHQISVIAI
ncbi:MULTISPECIES: 3-oxoacyl-[acyl-carrier-protein] synthase III C-terminal domain-containing protein [Dickeya]|uniref:3-oxoacyl-[acyl-carrier-protein] synthase III C-terminal domain-containing protein n=1 Tax=Dickeya TaxID=204037 RepID=UPI00039D2E6E|nr:MULTISPECIES: 3-oxoacyl-[acyl-carrier-protein] synthase III C-terminal domain-containing protein [Dickeya]